MPAGTLTHVLGLTSTDALGFAHALDLTEVPAGRTLCCLEIWPLALAHALRSLPLPIQVLLFWDSCQLLNASSCSAEVVTEFVMQFWAGSNRAKGHSSNSRFFRPHSFPRTQERWK